MAVISKDVVLWDHMPIYYVTPSDPKIGQAIAVLNEQVGFLLFASFKDSDRSVADVKFEIRDSGCSPIGKQSAQPQAITMRSSLQPRLMLHEMLHCVGFEHEQFHEKYPWDRTERFDPFAAVSQFKDFGRYAGRQAKQGRGRSGSGGPVDFLPARSGEKELGGQEYRPEVGRVDPMKDVNSRIYKYLCETEGDGYANGYLNDLPRKQSLEFSPDCDYDSIMMYPPFFQAAKKLWDGGYHEFSYVVPTTNGHSENLSKTDVEWVTKLYRDKVGNS